MASPKYNILYGRLSQEDERQSGNKKLDIVSIAFIIKFSFNDFCLFFIMLTYFL